MLETGMRVGDACLFDPSKLTRGETLWCYSFIQQKQRRALEKPRRHEVFLSDALKTRIDNCQWFSANLPFSYSKKRYLGQQVYDVMQAIGKRYSIPDCRPHRLRDTAAVRWLLDGLQVDDVSRLLGHADVGVTQRHYAKWTTDRKKRLEGILAKTLVNPQSN